MKYHSEFTKQYVQDICDALNDAGAVMDKQTGKPFDPENFRTLTSFLQDYVVRSLDYFTFLDERGLVNRGKCPYTGERIDESFPSWSFMNNRKVYVSHEGYKIMQKEDDEEYERVMGTPPPKRTSSSGKSGGCYIATVCYGNELAPEVLRLKLYRDEVLNKTTIGKIFIKIYYILSPRIANWLKNKEQVNLLVRDKLLNPIVKNISRK